MIVDKHKVVSIDYVLKDSEGRVLDSSDAGESLTYLHGADSIIPGLENALHGRSPADEFSVVVEPEDGFGPRDDSNAVEIPRDRMDGTDDVTVGMQLQVRTSDGPRVVYVVALSDSTVTIDANHPLAGVALHFDVTVIEVRDATSEEIAHGQLHDAHGHQQ